VFIEFAGTFEGIPPPTIYLILNAVFEGAKPYVCVDRKLLGSYAYRNVLLYGVAPTPIVSGTGVIIESCSAAIPDPNCTCNSLVDINLDTNLLGTFCKLST